MNRRLARLIPFAVLVLGLADSFPTLAHQDKPRSELQNPIPASDGPPKTLTNSIGMRFVTIPAGEFLMGTADNDNEVELEPEKPQHRVKISKPFYLGVTEVTRGQFRRFVDAEAYRTEMERALAPGGWLHDHKFTNEQYITWLNPEFEQSDDHPVVNVTWNDAVAFVAWLSRREGKTYRLPTEAEWEYACRARTTTRYQSGDDSESVLAVGNVGDASHARRFPFKGIAWPAAGSDGFVFTAPVGRFKPNAWGLFDMHGNVWEWCSDGYKSDSYKESTGIDPSGPSEAHLGVMRGGSWLNSPRYCRSATRGTFRRNNRSSDLGFRLALVQSVR
jgi:formylglycine-generating enzyme